MVSVPGQPAQPLGGYQGLPGQLARLVHPHRQETDGPFLRVLHGGQHIRVGQHHTLPAQLGIHLFLPGLVAHGPAPRHHRVPGGQVEHPGPGHRLAVDRLSLPLQREQIEQHLKAHTVPDVGEVKGFSPRLVVHHPQVEPPIVFPAVHPVHKAGDTDGDPVHTQLHRRQVLPAAKAQLKGDGLELGGPQLLGHILHHGVHRLTQPLKQVAEPGVLMFQAPQGLGHIALHRLIGELPQLLRRHLFHPAPLVAGF